MDIAITDLASLGVIKDVPGFQLPPEAFSLGENVRIVEDGVARLPGWAQIYASLTPSADPIFLAQLHTDNGAIWWVFATATKIFVIDGVPAITDVSIAGNYTSSEWWQSTFLASIPILNNGNDLPQFWASYNTATDFANLTNFPAGERCRVIRAFGPYLVALHPTISGTTYPHMVHWSHPADPGSVPASWDETDPVYDAGKQDLADTESGGIVDGYPLRGTFVIYKKHSTWLMRPTGGDFIFKFDQFLARSGVLNRECAQLTGDGGYHFVVTNDDIIIHDTVSVQSVIDKRMRSYLFNQIDPSSVDKCYVFANPRQKEMWFCYPEVGSAVVSRALIWNYGAGGGIGTLYEADYPFPWTALGDVQLTGDATWATVTGTWGTFFGQWNSSDTRRPVGVNPTGRKFLGLDSSLTRDGAAFTSRVSREGLALLGKRRGGEPLVDWKQRKFIRKVWPKVVGGPVNIRIGVQDTVDSSPSYTLPQSFDPTTQRHVDVARSGNALSYEVSTTDSVDWKLYGLDVEITRAGRF